MNLEGLRQRKVKKNTESDNDGEEEKNLTEHPQEVREEKVDEDTEKMEEDTRKEKDNMEVDMEKERYDPTSMGVTLSFLHTTKLKVDSSLQGDSWMYNELMTLKKRIGKIQQD